MLLLIVALSVKELMSEDRLSTGIFWHFGYEIG